MDHVEHRAVVAVRDHAALRRPGGARRVDEGADVVGRRPSCSAPPTRRRSAPAPRAERSSIEIASSLEPVMRITCSSFGQRVAHGADLLELLVVLDDDRVRVGVLEHVLALLGGVGLVDRDDGGAGGERGEVEVASTRGGCWRGSRPCRPSRSRGPSARARARGRSRRPRRRSCSTQSPVASSLVDHRALRAVLAAIASGKQVRDRLRCRSPPRWLADSSTVAVSIALSPPVRRFAAPGRAPPAGV